MADRQLEVLARDRAELDRSIGELQALRRRNSGRASAAIDPGFELTQRPGYVNVRWMLKRAHERVM